MLRLRRAATLAASALLACAGLASQAHAAEPQTNAQAQPQAQATPAAGSTLALNPPLYLSEQKPVADTSLQGLADRAGFGRVITDQGFTIGGWVQAGWTYNFDDPAGGFNIGRVFDFEDQDPTLHQLAVFVDRSVASDKWDVGGRMEWMWGGDARLIHSNGIFDDDGPFDGPDEQFDLTQLYVDVNVPVGSGLKIRVGKFVTPIGYETINPTNNALYSHSFLFGFAIPFTQSGILGYYNVNEEFQIYAGITRGWEQSCEDNNDAIDFLGGIVYTISPDTTLYFNTSIGPQQEDNDDDMRYLFDASLVHRFGDAWTFAANGDWGWEENSGIGGEDGMWCGLAGYASYKINEMFALNGRAEYFNDSDGARGLGTYVFGFTAGVDIKPLARERNWSSLRIRPEFRWDISDDPLFDGFTEDSQITFGVDVLFSF